MECGTLETVLSSRPVPLWCSGSPTTAQGQPKLSVQPTCSRSLVAVRKAPTRGGSLRAPGGYGLAPLLIAKIIHLPRNSLTSLREATLPSPTHHSTAVVAKQLSLACTVRIPKEGKEPSSEFPGTPRPSPSRSSESGQQKPKFTQSNVPEGKGLGLEG